MVIDNKITLAMPYGSARTDTASVCGAGNTNSGFGLLINFNTLGQGFHTASLFVNGENVGDTQFAVTVPNGEFISGAAKDVTVFDFPVPGASTTLTWQQSQQNFAVKSVVGVTTTTTGSGTTTTGNGTTTTGGTTTSTVEGATTTTMDMDAAKKLYTTYCVCHQPWERSGYNAQQVRDAINRVPDMSLLSFLTDDQLIGIAAYMNQEEFHHPP
jgi:hypothetical protein